MAEFDIVSKQLFKDYPQDFLRFVLGQEGIQLLEVIDTELPTVESRATDILVRVRIGDEEALVHIEFQTGDSTNVPMPRRMAGYIGRQIERFGLPVYAFVIYLRPDAGQRDSGQYSQGRAGFRVLIEYVVIRLIEEDGQQIIDQKLWGLLPFAPLMQPPENTPPESWLRLCIQTVDELALDEKSKVDFLADLSILSGLVYQPQTVFHIISEEIMYESSIVQHFTERASLQGKRQQRIEDVVEALEIRFTPSAAETLKPSIEAIDDLQTLKALLRSAILAPSLDEFKQTLNSMTNGN
jgi:predicted transposase YdaD